MTRSEHSTGRYRSGDGSHHVDGVRIDRGDRPGGWTPNTDVRLSTFATALEQLLPGLSEPVEAADRIAIVPDAHYPFHPSTGLVTDPALVGALVRLLEQRTDAELAVVGSDGPFVSFDRTTTYLGYGDVLDPVEASIETIAGPTDSEGSDSNRTQASEATLTTSAPASSGQGRRGIDAASSPRSSAVSPRIGEQNGEKVSSGSTTQRRRVTQRLQTAAVIVVPSLRPTRSGPIAGSIRTLSRAAGFDPADVNAGVTVIGDCSPSLAILDASVAYGDGPYALNHLFAGKSAAVDAVGATIFDLDPGADPVLAATFGADGGDLEERIFVDGVDIDAIRDTFPAGELPPSATPHPLIRTGYRIYARVSGDAVPPQLASSNSNDAGDVGGGG